SRDAANKADELLDAARSMVPTLRARQPETDELGRTPVETEKELESAGLFSLMLPSDYGGSETSVSTWMEVNTEIGRGDAGVGWAMTLINGCQWMAAECYPRSVSDEVFSTPNARVAGVFAPRGVEARRVEGGIVVDKGIWNMNSGVYHANWDLLGVPLLNEANEVTGHGVALVPMSDVNVLDDWDTIGLRGSGSSSVSMENVFIADERICDLQECIEGRFLGGFGDRPLYRSAFMPLMVILLAFPALGAGIHMLEEFLEQLPKRQILYTPYKKQGEAPVTHLQVGEASAKIDAARLLISHSCGEIDRWAQTTEYMPERNRARIGRDTGYADKLLWEACDILAQAAGGTFARNGNVLNRLWGDVKVANMHPFANFATNMEVYGGLLCGVSQPLRPV
ncbi:MAG TPA: acyl-CoA dehydrogenase family protein, partial [Solirubrobacterales bacterium]